MSDDLDAYRAAKQEGTADSYLDSLGRPKALEAAPQFVALANRALELLPAAHDRRRHMGHRKRNENWQPGLFDASGGLEDLMRQMAFEEYEIGGEIYTRAELLSRYDLISALEEQRRQEAEGAQRREDLARLEREWASKDANILLVVKLRLRPDVEAAE
jgi:hypothetical protein